MLIKRSSSPSTGLVNGLSLSAIAWMAIIFVTLLVMGVIPPGAIDPTHTIGVVDEATVR